jgi:hemin uptake protein HemP
MNPVQAPNAYRRTTLVLPARPATSTPNGPKRVDSGSLLSGNRELIIEHAGCEYRLRRTQNDKLILTK